MHPGPLTPMLPLKFFPESHQSSSLLSRSHLFSLLGSGSKPFSALNSNVSVCLASLSNRHTNLGSTPLFLRFVTWSSGVRAWLDSEGNAEGGVGYREGMWMIDSQPIIPFLLHREATHDMRKNWTHESCSLSYVLPFSLASNFPLPLTSQPQQTCFALKFQTDHRIGVSLMTLRKPMWCIFCW